MNQNLQIGGIPHEKNATLNVVTLKSTNAPKMDGFNYNLLLAYSSVIWCPADCTRRNVSTHSNRKFSCSFNTSILNL